MDTTIENNAAAANVTTDDSDTKASPVAAPVETTSQSNQLANQDDGPNNNSSNNNNNNNSNSVNKATNSGTNNNTSTSNNTQNNNSSTTNTNAGSNTNSGSNNRDRSTSNRRNRSRSPVQTRDPRSLRRVYVANVPFDVKWSELKDLFRDRVGNVVFCQLFENDDGKSRGCGLVEFSDQQTARRAIEVMHRSEFKGRELVVKEDLDCERDRQGRIINHNNARDRDNSQRRDGGAGGGGGGGNNTMGNMGNMGGPNRRIQQPNQDGYGYDHSVMSGPYGVSHYNTYGLSQQFLDSLGISGPLNNRVFVANLEYKVDTNKLEEIFKLAGKVARVKLSTDSQGQSKGYGTVEYEHPVESVQAISMFHNQKLYGRPMSVRMDKYECEDDADNLPTKLPSGLENIGKGLGVGGQPLNIAKSIMNAALIAPPHLSGPTGQPLSHVPQQQIQQPIQSAVSTQMQPMMAVAGHGMGESISTYPALQQHQANMANAHAGVAAANAAAGMTMAQNPASVSTMYHHQQQAVNTMQATQATHMNPQAVMPGMNNMNQMNNAANVGAPSTNNLSVYSTFERQFRDASKYATNSQANVNQQPQASAGWRS